MSELIISDESLNTMEKGEKYNISKDIKICFINLIDGNNYWDFKDHTRITHKEIVVDVYNDYVIRIA